MRVFHSINNFTEKKRLTVLTIGTFDGVHIGHQKIIERLNQLKEQIEGKSAILTFFPHPRRILNNKNGLKLLTTIDEKTKLLENLGLDYLIIEPFTEEFSQLSAAEFVKNILVDHLKINKLVIGYDHQFGKNREGNFEQLQKYGKLFNFELESIPAQDIDNVAISSTKIRKALNEGHILKANSYLGYNYLLTGKVVKGKGLGRKIKFPTVNIQINEDYKLIPKTGVYIVQSLVDKKSVFGIMNIGYRPTVNGKNQTIEVHLLDFQADLYGKKIQIEILNRLRDEQKFESIETLIIQIQKDELLARKWLKAQS
ncbi:MAG: bifunctional riboflavin kinase/FAD synthetase [Bacteroidota bacterium]